MICCDIFWSGQFPAALPLVAQQNVELFGFPNSLKAPHGEIYWKPILWKKDRIETTKILTGLIVKNMCCDCGDKKAGILEHYVL